MGAVLVASKATSFEIGELSEGTAPRIRGLPVWDASEYEHDGLHADGERILDRLIDLARGRH